MQNLEQKNREIHFLVIKENWLSGATDQARQAVMAFILDLLKVLHGRYEVQVYLIITPLTITQISI